MLPTSAETMKEAKLKEKDLEKQVAVLKQKLQQSEQLADDLRKREEASKKAYAILLSTINDFKYGENENLIVIPAHLERHTQRDSHAQEKQRTRHSDAEEFLERNDHSCAKLNEERQLQLSHLAASLGLPGPLR